MTYQAGCQRSVQKQQDQRNSHYEQGHRGEDNMVPDVDRHEVNHGKQTIRRQPTSEIAQAYQSEDDGVCECEPARPPKHCERKKHWN